MTQMLGLLLWEPAEGVNVMRCKGVFQGDGTGPDNRLGEYMLQGVGDIFELRPMAASQADLNKAKFLFVGRGIDKEAI